MIFLPILDIMCLASLYGYEITIGSKPENSYGKECLTDILLFIEDSYAYYKSDSMVFNELLKYYGVTPINKCGLISIGER